ncbi:MAG TPA: hypothetical protein QF646_07770 [Candidatus Poseidoniales archaeon]|nr:hypothetical protein [Candidatus Poseidoniales archaeon]
MSIGWTMGITHIFAFLAALTFLVLVFLAMLIIRARPKAPENRFMCVLLLAESWRVLANWYNLFPLGPEFLPYVQYYRVVWYFCGILCIMLYVSTVAFYPTKRTEFMTKEPIKNNLWWALPVISAVLLGLMIASNGSVASTIGGTVHVDCSQDMVFDSEGNAPAVLSYSPGTENINGTCSEDLSPYMYFVPESGTGLSLLLLVTPVFSAIFAVFLMRNAWGRLEAEGGREDEAYEARSLFIGFTGKALIKGIMVFSIIFTTVKFGRFNLADMTSIEDTDQLVIYLYCLYGFLFSILLTGMFEGFMFSYAILKNDILGIDERLRATFSTAVFATFGAILILLGTEAMESATGWGWAGGIIIGLPLIVLRKPIFSTINSFSSMLMPESFTANEKVYLEAYELAMEELSITAEGRRFLQLQAKTLNLNEQRIQYLESWYDASLEEEE